MTPSDSRPALSPTDVLREGLIDGCAFACGCDDPGNPQKCIHADRFAALSCVEKLVEAAEHVVYPFGTDADNVAEWHGSELLIALRPFLASPVVEQTVSLPEGFADAGKDG